MTSLLDRPAAAPGLVHLGLLYDDLDDMVARCVPEVRAALAEDAEVHVAMSRRGAREMRHALGDDARVVDFPPPTSAFQRGTPRYLAELRRKLPRDRQTLIVAQYVDEHPPSWDARFAEDAVNLVLGDMPLTVVCACDRAGSDANLALTERSHQHLIDDVGTRTSNPAWAPPSSSTPASLSPWGTPVATMTVDGAHALSTVRRRIGEIAERAGFRDDACQAAVLAVHEAVLLAGAADGDVATLSEERPEVRVRCWGDTLVTEVSARSAGTTATAAGWRADYLPRFCDRLSLHDDPSGRLVRVLSTEAGH